MIAFAAPDQRRHWRETTAITVTSNVDINSPTATAWANPDGYSTQYVIIYSGPSANYDPNPASIFDGVEPMWRRRWRLSLEAIARYRREARRVRLRVVSQWRRPVSVARTCSQAERWRVAA